MSLFPTQVDNLNAALSGSTGQTITNGQSTITIGTSILPSESDQLTEILSKDNFKWSHFRGSKVSKNTYGIIYPSLHQAQTYEYTFTNEDRTLVVNTHEDLYDFICKQRSKEQLKDTFRSEE